MNRPTQQDLPIQPVNKLILCSPFAEPTEHWVYRTDTGEPYQHPERRPANYGYKTQATPSSQMSLFAEKERKLPLVPDTHTYEKPGKYRVPIKVIDTFGNDTSQAFDVEVK